MKYRKYLFLICLFLLSSFCIPNTIAQVDEFDPTDIIFDEELWSNADSWHQGYTLIIMNNTDIDSSNQARDYVVSQGGRIAILSPPHIMLGWVTPELAEKLIGKYGVEYISYTPVDLIELEYRDDQTLAMVSFFNSVSSGLLMQEMEFSRAIEGEPLIDDALEHPEINEKDYKKNLERFGIAPSPRGNSDSMTGTVAVCLFFVESNGSIDSNLYTWNSTDQQNTFNRSVSGLSWWSQQAPSYGTSVSFTVYYYSATSPVTQQGYEPILHNAYSGEDSLWINQIMSNLTFNSGNKFARVAAFNTWLKGLYSTNWAYSVFIGYNPSPAPVNFTDGYAAYAYYGGPYTQMLFRNFDWGEENFGRVLAHETGHIFWACDEYYQAGYGGCTTCSYCNPWGPRPDIINGNCEQCNPDSVACMMRSNSYALCLYTPLQIGWPPDTTRPTVSVSLPCSSSCSSSVSPITVSGSATDSGGSGLKTVFVANDNGSYGADETVSGNSDTFAVSGISLEEGPNTIMVIAGDNALNLSDWYYIYVDYNPTTTTTTTTTTSTSSTTSTTTTTSTSTTSTTTTTTTTTTCTYLACLDADGDGFGDPNRFTTVHCFAVPPPDYVLDCTDCDDNDPIVHEDCVCQCPDDTTPPTGCISGRVTNLAGNPLANKKVKLKRGKTLVDTEITNGNGCYQFTNLTDGTYKVILKCCKTCTALRKKRTITGGGHVNGVNFECQ